ncbi:MAG: sensor histidine kinase [Alphaproteobacteria bacterium]
MTELFSTLLDTTGFPPRWYCGTAWTQELGWTHIVSDLVIFASYTMIPLVLAFFIFIRKDFPFQSIFLLFISFIFLCGIIHLVEASIFWEPWYRLSGAVKVLTAIVSVATVIALTRFIPQIMKLPKFLNMQLQTILENAPEAIIITDQAGIIESYNPAAERIFQHKEEDVLGNPLSAYIPSKFLLVNDGSIVECNLEKKDRSKVPTEITSSVVHMDHQMKKIFIIRDISTRKDYEEKVALNIELQKSNQELNSFAYIASHDLKSPLRAIRSLSSFVQEDCYSLLPDASKDHLQKIEDRIERMEALLDSLLAYSRIGKQPTQMSNVDCQQIFDTIIEETEAPEDFKFEMHGTMPTLETTPSLFTQVAQNLVENSVKYRSPDRPGEVIISCYDIGKNYEFTIKDNGVGIPKKFHEKAFKAFQRLNSGQEIDGSGIGLATVKKIVEYMGGKVVIDPNVTEGTTITFTWPKKHKNPNISSQQDIQEAS